jgi:1-acyl-sn-glycerol-3-phosphate acyltransferase
MRPYYFVCREICRLGFLAFFRGRAFGRCNVPTTGGALLVCNHQSFLDPVLAGLSLGRECHFMARDTLFRGGVFRPLIESLNAYPVKRGTADIGAIKETLKRLRAGALITVFPEGTRTEDGSVGPMQSGVVLIARKAGVPLVPVALLGAFECWPRTSRLPRPGPVVVAYGEPLTPEQVSAWTDERCIGEVRRRITAMMEAYRRLPLLSGLRQVKPHAAGAAAGGMVEVSDGRPESG